MGRALHLLTDTITVAEVTGRSGSGDPTFGTQSTLPARVENKLSKVLDNEGKEVLSSTRIYTETELTMNHRIWLPGTDTTDGNDSVRPLMVSNSSTPNGWTLYKTAL